MNTGSGVKNAASAVCASIAVAFRLRFYRPTSANTIDTTSTTASGPAPS
jgi:hypothetical protein